MRSKKVAHIFGPKTTMLAPTSSTTTAQKQAANLWRMTRFVGSFRASARIGTIAKAPKASGKRRSHVAQPKSAPARIQRSFFNAQSPNATLVIHVKRQTDPPFQL